MAKKINYAFAAIPKQIISDPDLTSLELRILCIIISAADDNFNCTLSYSSIAKMANNCRRAIIYNVQSLIEKGYLTKKGRAGYQHNNSIANILHFEAVKAGTSTASPLSSEKNAPYSAENAPYSAENALNQVHSDSLPSEPRCTESITSSKSLNNIYLKTKEKEEKETATADGAAVLSMPDGGQAAESSAKNECVEALAAKEQAALQLFSSCAFKSELNFVKFKNKDGKIVYVIRPKSKFAIVTNDEAQKLAAEIQKETGLCTGWANYKQYFNGETAVEG